MNWQKIIIELREALGSRAKVAKLAMCTEAHIKSIEAGRCEPAYSVGDRLVRMHDQMREMKPK